MTAQKNGWTPYTAMQQRLSYLNPKFGVAPKYVYNEVANRERMRFLREKNMPLISYSCLCKGAYEDPTRLPAEYEGGERLAFIREMAAQKGVIPSALVVAWLTNLHRCEGFPRVIPLFSAKADHLEQNLRGLDLVLSEDELNIMNNV